MRRTKEEAQETRNQILDAAEQVFSEKGVSRATLDDIARGAGVTRGAVYWHFKDKADLFAAMLERVVLPLEDMWQSPESAQDPLAQLRSCSLAALRRATGDAHRRRVFEIVYHKCEYVEDMASLRERHLQCRAECLAHIEERFRRAQRMKLLARAVDPRQAAIGLHALIDGLLSNWVLDPNYLPDETHAERIVDRFLAGLRYDAPGEPATTKRAPRRAVAKRAAAARA